jgi:hypothetical protein
MSTTLHRDYCCYMLCQILVSILTICCVLYAGCYMPSLICQFLYVECHVLATVNLQSYQFICLSQYQFLHALCQISHASYSILAFICRHMNAKSSLWFVKLAYMSNCYILVYMPSALFQELYAECYGLYAKLHTLDCNMPNAMTIVMSFSMSTE